MADPSISGYYTPNDARLETVFGIDGLRLSVRLVTEPERFSSWRPSRREGWGWRSTSPLVAGTRVYLAAGQEDGHWWGTIDVHPSRVDDPSGWRPCGVPALWPIIELVWAEISRHARPFPDDPMTAAVRRIDVTRDFIVADPVPYLLGLQHLPRSRATVNRLHSDPQTGAPTGLEVGSVSGGRVSLYDKQAQNQRVPEPTIRWEAQSRGWAKRYGDIATVADLDTLHVEQLGSNRWAWSKAGTVITPVPGLVQLLSRRFSDGRTSREVLGEMIFRAHGHTTRDSKRLDAHIQELGIVTSPEMLCPETATDAMCLDLASGTERRPSIAELLEEICGSG